MYGLFTMPLYCLQKPGLANILYKKTCWQKLKEFIVITMYGFDSVDDDLRLQGGQYEIVPQ